MTIVQDIYHKNIDISDIELAEEIIKHPKLEILDLWLLPQYAFDKWRRKYDYPGILKNIKDNVSDFVSWMNDQGITDEYLLSGYFSDFFEHKAYNADKKKALIRTTHKGKEWLQVWYKYDGEKESEGDGEPVRYEYIQHFIPYYDWVEDKGGRFCFTDTFFRSNPNTLHENTFLNHNYKLLKMGGIHPPLNGFGAMLRGKKLEFVNVSGLILHGTIYFSNFGNLSFHHCTVDNMKCDELDMPNLDFYYSSIKNFQVRNSEISHWMFLYSKTSGNIIDSKFTHTRIYGGQFTPTFTNTQLDMIDVRHKDLFCEPDFEKTYRVLAKCAKDSGDKQMSKNLKIAEYDFIRGKEKGIAKVLMIIDKLYWEYVEISPSLGDLIKGINSYTIANKANDKLVIFFANLQGRLSKYAIQYSEKTGNESIGTLEHSKEIMVVDGFYKGGMPDSKYDLKTGAKMDKTGEV